MAMVAAGFTGGQAEELRRAFGFKRSERRMKQIEVQLRDGMARTGITGEAAEQIITSITSFALYGFPESHAASFALLAYASAYLKVHYPGGVLHGAPQQPADGVLSPVDARQGRAAPRRPVSSDRRAGVRLGLHGRSRRRDPARAALRERPARGGRESDRSASLSWHPAGLTACPHAAGSTIRRALGASASAGDGRRHQMLSEMRLRRSIDARARGPTEPLVLQQLLARLAGADANRSRRFASLDDLVARTGLRRDEVVTLADIGALNSFGYDRRSALWQAERAVRPSGELFDETQRTQRPQRMRRTRAADVARALRCSRRLAQRLWPRLEPVEPVP